VFPRRLTIVAACAAVLALSTTAMATASPVPSPQRSLSAAALRHTRYAAGHSLNWSGYTKTGTAITASTASWHVPTLKNNYDGYSSTWVGIDGASSADPYLIQTGTEGDVVNGRAEYHAWWEVITPSDEAPEVLFTSFSVHPGDSIRASVTKNPSGTWTMSLRNNTTGKTASHSAAFGGPGKSAEWIQEDTDVNGYISAAPNWQSVAFSSITVNGASPRLSASQALNLVDSHGVVEDRTGTPNSSGNGFTITWLAPGSRTYVG
jgi:hypothetical protein